MQSEVELLKIGTGLLDTFKYQKALEVFSSVIKLNPENSEAYELRAIANFRILNIESALEDISKAIQINPDSHQAWFNKGEILERKGTIRKLKTVIWKLTSYIPIVYFI